uniref:inositol-polyphosphate 5-phosphatase n=1 Tax=Anopheles atroparvus TaxID=41427 RepID=A0AAG5DY86_ANOAO
MASAEPDTIPILLVTANVGSVFEDPSKLLHLWLREFLDHVAQRRPAFIALHLQEVGGKTYEKSMEYVQEFIKKLCESDELRDYNRIRVYLDEDYNSAEHFTALGNLYFVQNTVDDVLMWNFLTHEWDPVEGKSIHTGSIETVASKEKAKFPQQFFPECKWSRKGFLRTRWFLNGTVFDLVNIHLFHDASNLAACEEYPSVYCKSRRRALVHTLERFHKDTANRPVPYFVFGDFNFRCDTEGVIKKLTEDLTVHRVQNAKHDSTKVQYRDADGANVLTVGKKEFFHNDQSTFKESWLRQFDRELDSLRSILYEYPITFPPSYPYEEDPLQPCSYMATRCPAWCDRILVSPAARKLISEGSTGDSYGIIGADVCMGDHKPVYLSTRIKTSQGILDYCSCDTHAPTTPRVEHTVPNRSSASSDSSSNSHTNVIVSHSSSGSNAGPAAKVNVALSASTGSARHPPGGSGRGSGTSSTILPIADSAPQPCAICAVRIEQCFGRNLGELEQNAAANIGLGLLATEAPATFASDDRCPPVVSISVFDTDSNLNVCMCALYCSKARAAQSGDGESEAAGADTVPPICPNCRNIIKHQPVEHRKTLISRRMMLTNDIIVNRIDTHYLNTYTTLAGTVGSNGASSDRTHPAHQHHRFEPYTPESAESHSPLPESYESSKGSRTTTTNGTDGGDDVSGIGGDGGVADVDGCANDSGGGAGGAGAGVDGNLDDLVIRNDVDDYDEDDHDTPALLLSREEEQRPLLTVVSGPPACPIEPEVTITKEPLSSVSGLPPLAKHTPSSAVANKGGKGAKPQEAGGGGGFSGVSPRQLKSRLEKLKRMADERRKQYGEWTRNRSRCDTARSDNSSSGTLTVPLAGGDISGDVGERAALATAAAIGSTDAPVLSIRMVDHAGGGTAAKASNNNDRSQGDSLPGTAAVVDGAAVAPPRDTLLAGGCCRGMCTIL